MKKCTECEYCKLSEMSSGGWQEMQCGLADDRLICYKVKLCYASKPIKTHPRWCPLRGKGPLATIVRKGNIEVVVK